MKKGGLIAGIVAVHCVLIGSVALLQGCGTTPAPVEPPPPQVVMPPAVEPAPLPPVVMPPPVKAAPPVQVTKTYTVKAGDSLSMIGKRFNVSTRDLMKMNKITNANKIHAGQKLTLPGYVNLNAPVPPRPKKAAAPVKKAVAKATATAAGPGEYIVKSGDTLGAIAVRNGTSVAAIKQANSLSSDRLQVNQKLVIPGAGAAPVAAPVAPVAPAAVEQGAAPVESEIPAEGALPEPKANEVLHVAEPNQDLNSIAMMYGVRVEDLMRLNNLATPDIKVGQTLKIPPPID